MTALEVGMPALLRALHEVEIDYADGDGIEFEPYSEFLSAEETRSWIQAWTGNDALDGHEFRVFGQDGSGGYAAIWLAREGRPLPEQPIVFFGSEGQLGVVASGLNEYLWVLAGGIGPLEAILFPGLEREADPSFRAFAEQHSSCGPLSPWAVVAKAQAEFPQFAQQVRSLCR